MNAIASYVSTTIPYVNAPPHVGFALELVQADALARFERLAGRGVLTSTGSDDHSRSYVVTCAACNCRVREAQKRSRGLCKFQALKSPTCGPAGVLSRHT